MKIKFLLIIFLISLLPFSWFANNQVVAQKGDGHFSFSLENTLKLNQYVWQEPWLGRNNHRGVATLLVYDLPLFLLSQLGLSPAITEKLLFSFLLFLSGFSFFWLVHSLLKGKNDLLASLAALIGANFYMFNLYSLQFQWDHYASLYAYGLAPLILSSFLKLQKKFTLANLVSIGLLLFLASPSLSNPLYFGFIFIILAYFLVIRSLLGEGKFFPSLCFLALIFTIAALINGFAFFPQIPASGEEQVLITLMPESDLEYIAMVNSTRSFHEGFRFLGHWGFWGSWGEDNPYYPYHGTYETPLFIFLGFMIPLFAFSGLVFGRHYRREMIAFGLLALIAFLLMAGPNPPFGGIYTFCFKYLPGFWGFRRPFDKFGPFFIFGMAGLLSFSSFCWLRKLETKSKDLLTITSVLILMVINLYAFPFWTGDILPDFSHSALVSNKVALPDYYQEASNYLHQENNSFRVLVLPFSHTYSPVYLWDYGGVDPLRDLIPEHYLSAFPKTQDRPILKLLYDLGEGKGFIQHLINLSSWLNYHYLLVDQSLNFDFGQLQIRPEELIAMIEKNKAINLIKKFGELNLYEIDPNLALSRFYLPQKIIYLKGEIENLADLASFEDHELRSGVYWENSNSTNSEILNRAEEIFIGTIQESALDQQYLGKIEIYKRMVPFPYVRHKPGSLDWKLARGKEKWIEAVFGLNRERLIDKKLFYAGKRISELEKWGEEKEAEYLIRQAYQEKMAEVIEEIERLKDSETKEETKIKLRAYLERHQEKLKELEGWENWQGVFGELAAKIEPLKKKFDLRNLEYRFEIPQEGEYELFIKSDTLDETLISQIEMTINTEKIEAGKVKLREDGWGSLGKRFFQEGKHHSVLRLPEPKNLLGDNWQKPKEAEIKQEEISFPQGFFPPSQSLVFQEINGWEQGSLYLITFDFQTGGMEVGVGILEEKKANQAEKIFEKILNVKDWQKFSLVVKASPEASGAKIYFWRLAESLETTKAEFRNFKVYRIIQPRLVLRKIRFHPQDYTPPISQITFKKISPTKYRLKIEGVKEAYTLIFSESFHQGWKVYFSEAEETKGNIFETWGKRPIGEGKHLLINGYANSWYLDPSDVEARENYELIIEFWPQRLFYLGLFISGLTLISGGGYLGYHLVKRK